MNIYDEIGVARVINASGSMTHLGGSLPAPEVVEAMSRAAGSFVRVHELMERAGEVVAEITGAEAGLVTTGAAGGMLLAAAACMTGKDRGKMHRLPDTEGMKNEIVVQRLHRVPFDHAVRTAGGRLVEVGDALGTEAWEIEAAIGERTAALLHVILDPQPTVSLEEAFEIAHRNGVPVVLDAAAELPPVENLRNFVAVGADLTIFSGGKDIGGPNDTGILCGRRELIEAAAMQAFPNFGIGRPLKVSKEQIVGLVVALRGYVEKDFEIERERWKRMVDYVGEQLQGIPGARAEIAFATGGARPLCIPRVRVEVDEEALGKTVVEIDRELGEGNPAVEVYVEVERAALWINPQHLIEGEEEIVAQRVRGALT